jgi:D-alanyl-lipoteichoic acid acyltransferase DltB (MBOAT superfamily)
MLIGGLWHGASWNFVIWGGLHGLYLAVHKYWMGLRGLKEPPRPTSQRQWPAFLFKGLVTFHLVAFAWIFFRAPDFATASTVIQRIFTSWNGLQPTLFLLPMLYGALLLAVDIPQYRSGSHTIFERWPAPARTLFCASLLALIFLLGGSGSATFIYFQF